jgi:hypothetical protein
MTVAAAPAASTGSTAVRPYARRATTGHRPGAPRLRYLPLPDTEPPVERGAVEEPAGACLGQGVLALLAEEDDEDEVLFGPQPTPSRELPDPARWGRQITQLIVEVTTGHRPAAQLARWTCEHVYRQVRQQARPLPLAPRRPGSGVAGRGQSERPVVGGVRVSEPGDGIAEVAAVVHRRHRVQAMALRLEGRDGRWVVTALQCG